MNSSIVIYIFYKEILLWGNLPICLNNNDVLFKNRVDYTVLLVYTFDIKSIQYTHYITNNVIVNI